MKALVLGIVAVQLLFACGCAAARYAYCDKRNPDGSCAVWAKHPTECVHDVYGDCQK
jgi:hypothetical protein